MQPLFKYIDYRAYLADFYSQQKSTTRHFSYRYFAERAGIKSPVFLKQVIDGERNLTRPMIEKFITAMKLTKKEAVFFRNLVQFNQAKSAEEKQEHYSVMLSMNDYVQEHQLFSDQYSYYEKWYTAVIRELVCLHDFGDDFELLAQAVEPPISRREAEKAMELLLRLKLVKKLPDGIYRQTDTSITSGHEMFSLAVRSFNSAMLEFAKQSNEARPASERNISGITMGISPECYNVIVAEARAFKERVIAIVNQDEKSSRVYQLNLSLFPLSRDVSQLKKSPHQEGAV
jgi:uncharacterized protein (TIGR02147 family)